MPIADRTGQAVNLFFARFVQEGGALPDQRRFERVMCLTCSAVVDDCWRWCPECGGQVPPPFGPLDLRIQPGNAPRGECLTPLTAPTAWVCKRAILTPPSEFTSLLAGVERV